MTAHADSVAEAELPPLTSGPHRQADRPHLGRRLPGRPAVRLRHRRGQRRRGSDGQRTRALAAAAGRGHQLAAVRRCDRCPARRDHLRQDRAPQDHPDPGAVVLLRRPAGGVLAGRTRVGHLLPGGLRGPGGRPHRARARGRWRIDGGPGLPRRAGALRDPWLDHRAQRVGHRRRAVVGIRGERDSSV